MTFVLYTVGSMYTVFNDALLTAAALDLISRRTVTTMNVLAAIAGLLLILAALWDGFETIVLPRRVTRQIRLTSLFYYSTWRPWAAIGRRLNGNRRETYLSFYGPLSLIFLLIVWISMLVLGFALLQWADGSRLHAAGATVGFGTDIYMSATSFFTLGIGDVTPTSSLARAITAVEAGSGFGFLALVITYLPVLYGAFSAREANISLLDARAGSPPSAPGLLLRLERKERDRALPDTLQDWEQWAGRLLESHLSYPVLGFYRSQHEHQSWLAALTVILDTCSLVISGVAVSSKHAIEQARLTFAIARHAAVDLSQVFRTDPSSGLASDRLPSEDLGRLIQILGRKEGAPGQEEVRRLAELRIMYEPYVAALSRRLLMPLPSWLPSEREDDWQTTAWE
jgi:hypothetical protein